MLAVLNLVTSRHVGACVLCRFESGCRVCRSFGNRDAAIADVVTSTSFACDVSHLFRAWSAGRTTGKEVKFTPHRAISKFRFTKEYNSVKRSAVSRAGGQQNAGPCVIRCGEISATSWGAPSLSSVVLENSGEDRIIPWLSLC